MSGPEVGLTEFSTPAAPASSNPNHNLTMNFVSRLCLGFSSRCWSSALACMFALSLPAVAQSGSGTVEGRVFNPTTGDYVENARISIEGTALETFTDALGQYRLTNVPAGSVRVSVFRTGVPPQAMSVTIAAGQIVQQDFNLTAPRSTAGTDTTVKLDEFVVAASREMDAAAIAINTQRFAPNVMNVVAADEFGTVISGGAGEVLKSLPGIAPNLGGRGEPHTMSINGVPSNNVPVTIGGFSLAQSGTTSREVGLHQISIATFSRIEVAYTPTPETPGAALAGSINMVPRSAFERAKPVVELSTSLIMRDNERAFHKTPGPGRTPTRKVTNGFDFSAIVPVNSRFGFTVSSTTFPLYSPTEFSQNTWRGAGAATNGTTLPDTSPGAPYLTDYAVRVSTSWSRRTVHAATLDYKLSRNDRLSLALQYSLYYDAVNNRTLTFLVNRVAPGNFATTFTHGFAGAGEVRLESAALKWSDRLFMPTLTWRHDGPIWKSDVGVGHSRSTRKRLDFSNGHFNSATARRQGVTVSFDDIFYLRPRVITVTDGATGAPVDPFDIRNFYINTTNSNQLDTVNAERSLFGNIRRSFYGSIPLTLKAGVDVRHSMRDIRQINPTFTFVGADGRNTTATTTAGSDDGAVQVFDRSFSQRTSPFGFPSIQWLSNEQLFDLYLAHPAWFTVNDATSYNREVALSKHAEELISSAYFRTDAQFLEGRLKLVGGIRAEQTNVKAEGALTDPTRNFQRDASGKPILGPNGQPLPITTNALEAAKLTNVDRGLHTEKEYLRWFPSLNASYNIRENIIARGGYYWSLGRPEFGQYAGSLTLPNTENSPGPNNRISVNNAAIKAWSAQTWKLGLEYYFEGTGLFSVGVFRRDFENMFASTVTAATPEFLTFYNLDSGVYGGYDVSTQYNLASTVRMTGVDFNYKQSLTFLPRWARGVQVFANASAQRATGDASGSFSGYTPRTANWGVSLLREKYNLRVKWNYKGRQRQGPVAAGPSIEPGTYTWGSKRLLVDVSAEYYFAKRFAAFANLNNVFDAPVDLQIYGPSTPEEAQFRQRRAFGSLWTFGIKASF